MGPLNRLVTWRLALKDNFSEREVSTVGDGQRDIFYAQAFGDLRGDAGEPQRRPAAGLAHHFDIAPANAAPPARPQRLHPRFFCGKAAGVSLEFIPVALAVRNFRRRIQALQNGRAMPRKRRFDAVNFRNV